MMEEEEEGESTSPFHVIQLNSKPGMQGLDIDKINKIINQASKGSKFYEHKKKRQDELDKRISLMKEQAGALMEDVIKKGEKEADEMLMEMEGKRELSRFMVHLDMDCFFAAVEMRDDSSLRDVPMAVGGTSMLSTSNYLARRYGVRAAMPGFIALKLCPELKIVRPNYDKYRAASRQVESILEEYDSEGSLWMSMDEAQMDITGCLAKRNASLPDDKKLSPESLVNEMRQKIFERTNLTASAGIAFNGLLAKICSDINKPNNQFFLEPKLDVIDRFVRDLPIRKVSGIGPVTEQLLQKALGIQTCGDLWEKRGLVKLLFKPSTGHFLLSVSKGFGSSFFSFSSQDEGHGSGRKSISCERTFGTATKEELQHLCQSISEDLERDLESKGATCRTIALKIKTIQFEVKTRARSIGSYTSRANVIFDTAWAIYGSFEREIPHLKLRLIGIRVSTLKFEGSETEGGMKQATLSQMFGKVEKACSSSGDESLLDEEEDNSDHSSILTAECPICNKTLKFNSQDDMNRKLNAHIDECLNISAVNSIREEERTKEAEREVPCSSISVIKPVKRPNESTTSSNLRKKRILTSSNSNKTQYLPIDAYFQRKGDLSEPP